MHIYIYGVNAMYIYIRRTCYLPAHNGLQNSTRTPLSQAQVIIYAYIRIYVYMYICINSYIYGVNAMYINIRRTCYLPVHNGEPSNPRTPSSQAQVIK